jgi:hypothetical protein
MLATNSHHFPIQHSLIGLTKKNVDKNIVCRKMIGFMLNWKIVFNNKYPDYVIFFLQLTQYFCNIRFQFNNCQVLSVSWVSVHNRYSKYIPAESKRVWTCLIMDCYTPSKISGWLRMVWQTSKMRRRSLSSFLFGGEYRKPFKCLHR